MSISHQGAAAVRSVGLTVQLGARTVLDSITFEVRRGEWLALVGPNGAGKTSLLRAIAGLVHAKGALDVDGCRPRHVSPRRLARHVGYVPQTPDVPSGMTVEEYVCLGRTAHVPYFGVETSRDLEVVREVIELLDLTALRGRLLAELSGGERQRAVLARALAQEAPVLLLDEPTASLDLGHQQQVLELVDGLRAGRALTVLSAIHDLTLASQFADRLLVLSAGRCVATGPPRAVLTEELVSEHWGAPVAILTGPDGALVVTSRRLTAPTTAPDDRNDRTARDRARLRPARP